jgi:hypothetical protein
VCVIQARPPIAIEVLDHPQLKQRETQLHEHQAELQARDALIDEQAQTVAAIWPLSTDRNVYTELFMCPR